MKKKLIPVLIIAAITASLAIYQRVVEAAPTSFVASYITFTPRSNYSDYVGYCFTVGSSDLQVTDVGRWKISGNSGTHTVKITTRTSTTALTSGSVDTTTGSAGGFVYASATPYTLTAGGQYCIMSLETSGGDQWYDISFSNLITVTSGAGTVTEGVYLAGSSFNFVAAGNSTGYGIPNFKYEIVGAGGAVTNSPPIIMFE